MESRTDQRDLALLLRIARLATADAEPAECLERILDELLGAFAADSGSIALLNPNTGLLETEVMRGAGAGRPADFALRPGQGVTGWVALHARSRLVADTAADRARLREIFDRVVLPRWAQRCGPTCVTAWNRTMAPAVGGALGTGTAGK